MIFDLGVCEKKKKLNVNKILLNLKSSYVIIINQNS